MPIVPYTHHGGGQVPLRAFLPELSSSSSISSALLPTYPPAVVSSTSQDIPPLNVAPGASHRPNHPIVDIAIEHTSHEKPAGPVPSPSPYSAASLSNVSDTQMKGRKPAIAAAGTFFSLFTFSQLYQHVFFEKITAPSERADEAYFIGSSRSWLDRRVCGWFGLCGLAHLNRSNWNKFKSEQIKPVYAKPTEKADLGGFIKDAQTLPENWPEKELKDRDIPQYVLDHAPLIHLYSGEEFWPGDMKDHLWHTTPHLNYTPLQGVDEHPTLDNLADLNDWGRFVYLTSDDNPEETPPPEWLAGEANIPNVPEDSIPDDSDEGGRSGGHFEEDKEGEKAPWFKSGEGDTIDRGGIRPTGSTSAPILVPTKTPEGDQLVDKPYFRAELVRDRAKKRGRKVVGGKSDAPAVLIIVPKDDGVVDAFWFFFYSFNRGNSVFNIVFGNHVGDWEHTTVRFQHGVPKAIFFSEHSFGEAYTWEAVEKSGKRPIGFSATGSHAMYATPGVHPYVLPGGILHDVTDRGPLWDPAMNMLSYTYDYKRDNLQSSSRNHEEAPRNWFYFNGHWGDKFYPLSDPRQYRFLGQYHYVNGPLGPRFKNLGRQQICQGNGECLLKKWIGDKSHSRLKRYPDVGEGEEMSADDVRRFVGPEEDPA
ncbi:vacuolar sorting-associated protein-like protein [Byssothecium circinans]|uniref:Vacuolar sorting-associated protein-like protein n=1 Tax=Byssothecium circinans TaxID=147558 RepID=A0A6A5UII6_9PLEO|nr:vacuolar sorting-associated protein-like protein [Byssothecium circinans]